MAEIEKHNFVLCLINQAIYTTDRYGNRKLDSGGGVALKHDVHMSVKLELDHDYTEGSFLITRTSKMAIDKSKISPEIWDIPVVLDIREGGKIDEVLSLVEYFLWNGWITQTSGWYTLETLVSQSFDNPYYPILESYTKKRRYNDLVQLVRDTPELYLSLCYTYIHKLESIYKLQANVMHDYKMKLVEKLNEFFRTYTYDYDPSIEANRDRLYELKSRLDSSDELISKLYSFDYEYINLDTGDTYDRLCVDENTGVPSIVSKSLVKSILDYLYNEL